MRINAINTISAKPINRNIKNKNSYINNQITFGISEHERRVREKQADLTKNMGWWDKNIFGGNSKARTEAERAVDAEDLARDKELIRQATINEESKKRIAQQAEYTAHINKLNEDNDFDEFVNSKRLIGPLKSYFDSISKDYHATVIATTSVPDKIDDILLRSGRFGAKIAIPAVSKTDIFSCIIKYLPVDFVDSFNIDTLVQKLEETKNGGAYTVKQIKDFINSLIETKQFKNMFPEIKQETLQIFKKQIEYIKHI